MSVDTSREAVESRAARMEAAAIAYKERAPCCGEVCSSGVCAAPACNFGAVMGGLQDGAATLRALLARAEAAEADITRLYDCLNTEANQRDAAIAERDRLAEALRKIIAQDWWDATERQGDEADTVDGRCAEIARAALASINKDPTDGE